VFKKMLYYSSLCSNRVKETRDHIGNGANPKSQKSRGNIKYQNFYYLFLLLFFSFITAPKSYSQTGLITVQGGGGVSYGGIGTKVTATWDSWIGVSGGIGYYKGTPLAQGTIKGESTSDYTYDLSKNNLSGLGFAIGLDFWFSCKTYMSVQFIRTGSYSGKYEYEKKMPAYGFNWTFFGGQVHVGKSGVFFDFAGNLALVTAKTKEYGNKHNGFIGGLSIGIGYIFAY